ncbi:MAG: ABC transporter substrate-binding protein [candidate division KSB1 bacterium]|nr:ABC transporter substrate-binding protein [candidate division KSB1 bacterium]
MDRQRWPILVILALALLAPGCGRQARQKPRILVSPKGLTHSFWLTVKAGADSAAREFGAEIIWKGPSVETDVAGQIAILEDYINKKVDAIVMAACDEQGLVPVIEKAQAAGIPVITIDSGVRSEIPKSFVATDNVAAARKAADVLCDLIGDEGEVACIPFVPGAATSILREQGFKEGLANHPRVKLVAVQYSQSDVATGMAVTENILTAHPELDGIFAANEPGAIGAGQALISRGLVGKVKLVAFDAAPNEIQALEAGVIQALIVQDPFKMGYLGVKYALEVLQGKEIPRRVDTGVYVVTRENLNDPEIQRLLYPLGKS